jgi:light-regulated signal transduction histidine kinase (bacteriophytochrome)
MTDGREHILEVFEERLGGHFLVTTTPLCDAEGRLVGSIHMARDITAQKRSENELRRTAEELARSNQELEQFAYVASHDLQEPLRMVTGFLDLLRQRHGDKLDGKAAEYVNFAMEGAQRMSQLIRDLLAYSRVQSKAWDPAPTDMKIVFERAASNCITTIRETEARVKGDGLPTVRGDPTQLVQLLQNLISNALKFRRPDVRPEVRVAARRGNDGDGDPWVFSVEDNGIGIPADQTDRVFLIFQRLHTREEYPGTGMGLAIAKRSVERHGGRIWIESRDEGGTRFMFTLPE